MSLQHVDMESALRRLADRRIEDAMAEGKFDRLAGAGKPLDLEPLPADENARMTYWALRILRRNDVTPDEVQWRKWVDGLRAQIDGLLDERHLGPLVAAVNAVVRRVNTLGTNALGGNLAPLDYDTELTRFRARVNTDADRAG